MVWRKSREISLDQRCKAGTREAQKLHNPSSEASECFVTSSSLNRTHLQGSFVADKVSTRLVSSQPQLPGLIRYILGVNVTSSFHPTHLPRTLVNIICQPEAPRLAPTLPPYTEVDSCNSGESKSCSWIERLSSNLEDHPITSPVNGSIDDPAMVCLAMRLFYIQGSQGLSWA